MLPDSEVELRTTGSWGIGQGIKAIRPVQPDQTESRHEDARTESGGFVQLERVEVLIRIPVVAGFGKGKSINGGGTSRRYRISQFQPKFVINDATLYRIASAEPSVTIPVVERGGDFVVLISAQADNFLTQQEGVEPACKSVASEEEALKRSDTSPVGV